MSKLAPALAFIAAINEAPGVVRTSGALRFQSE